MPFVLQNLLNKYYIIVDIDKKKSKVIDWIKSLISKI